MRIDKLELSNFKNFKNLTASFSPGVNLFVGNNRSGKTSLLEGLCVAVGAFFGSQEQKLQRVIKFDEIKITEGLRERKATVKAESSYITSWHRSIDSKTRRNDSKYIRTASKYGWRFFKEFENPKSSLIAPLFAYYSTQRLFKDAHQSKKQTFDFSIGRRNGYIEALEENAIKALLVDWLGKAVTRRATLSIKNISFDDLVLINVEQAIRGLLVDFLELAPDFNLKIYQDAYQNNELYIDFTSEPPLPLTYYADGFRNLLFMVMDMVWRASQLNPWLTFEELKSNIFGVVLIDEVDLHLHPKWQSKVIPHIQTLFPNVQFFITTHSPTVIANFSGGTLYIIDNNMITVCDEKYFGKEVNYILKAILGSPIRHVDTQNKLDLLYKMIDEEKSETHFNPLLTELKELIGESDSDIQRALSLIEWNKYKKEDPDAIHS